MTDNEIIKIIRHCINETCGGCKREDNNFHTSDSCRYDLLKIALGLIKRQQAEIERLHKLQKPTGAGGFKIENGKVIFYSNMLNGYRHEYKDIEEIVKELNLYMHTGYKNIELISHYQHKAQTAKSEAIKEFAEKFKEEVVQIPAWGAVAAKRIDNLAREMTEQKE